MDNRQRAELVYSLLKSYLQKQGIAHTDAPLGMEFTVNGEEFPIGMRASVNADTQRLDIVSVLPFAVRKERFAEITRVLNYLNAGLCGGKFVSDVRNDTVAYIYSVGYADAGKITEPFVETAISIAFHQTDAYFARLYAVAKGLMSARELAASER